ncbi:MAG: hypothetical protein ABIR73_14810 [Usitatibacter sp.]
MGLAGVALLGVARLMQRPEMPAYFRVLDGGSAPLIRALVPVVLAGSLPTREPERDVAIQEVVEAFDRAVAGLTPAVQGEIDDLLGVLCFGPTRLVLTGLWTPIEMAGGEEIAQFLTRWRTGRFDLLRAGYQALTQLIQASWYDNPTAWAVIGYPGPPQMPGRS